MDKFKKKEGINIAKKNKKKKLRNKMEEKGGGGNMQKKKNWRKFHENGFDGNKMIKFVLALTRINFKDQSD